MSKINVIEFVLSRFKSLMNIKKMNLHPCYKLLLVTMLLALSNNAIAQKDSAMHGAVFTEIGGPGGVLSINYEHHFPFNSKMGFTSGLGIGYWWGEFALVVPFKIYRKIFDSETVGVGLSITQFFDGYQNYTSKYFVVFGNLEYKSITENKKWYWSLSFTPVLSKEIQLWGGIKIGRNIQFTNHRKRQHNYFKPRKKYHLNTR